jgi:hypothetical protein
MQATAVTQATTVRPAASNIKDDSNIMTAHNSRKASNSRNESNNRYINTVWTPPKAGMLAKTVKPSTAWREANSSRDNRNITPSTAEGRPIISRMPEKEEAIANNSTSISRYANSTIWTPTAQYVRQQHTMDANSTIWTPTTPEFSRKFAI